MERARRPIRYLLIGAACAVSQSGFMIGADQLGLHYVWSTMMSFLCVTPMAFLLHARFTFDSPATWRGLWLFMLGAAAGFPLSLAVMAVLSSGLRLPMVIAAPIATVALIAWNYLSARFSIIGRASGRCPG